VLIRDDVVLVVAWPFEVYADVDVVEASRYW
jgi:hypothetical protein